tara:strand:+ start:148 stop:630 length:483 start_codon:yes stop_codon:yes gene_type:complete
MIKKEYVFNFLVFCIIIISQIYVPVVRIGQIQIYPDIYLVYITVISLIYGRFPALIVGFLSGLIQDFSTQSDLLGIFLLSKSISAYFLGTIFNYANIWSYRVKVFVLVSAYFIHFFIYCYLLSRSFIDFYYFLIFIIIQTCISSILFFLTNNLVYRNKLL